MGFPIAIVRDMGLNGECKICPCGEFCYNVYKYDLLCFDHRSLDKEDPNGEISDLLKNVNLNEMK